MIFLLILKGIIAGITASAPLGPLGILCIQRTINKGFLSGFITGLGAAFADILYASVAGFSISIIADFLKEYQDYIRGIGGIIVIILGVMIFRSNPVKQIRRQKAQKPSYISYFISSFFITMTNPITIVYFGLVLASFGLNQNSTMNTIMLILTGIFLGALFWWISLNLVVNIFRNKIRLRNLYWINKITGVLVVAFGIAVFVSIFFEVI